MIKLFRIIMLAFAAGFNDGSQNGGHDSGGGGQIKNGNVLELHFFAGTDNAGGVNGVFNCHYKSVDSGKTVVRLPDAPWAKRNEQGYASCRNRIFMWGGTSYLGSSKPLLDSWYYDNSGWSKLTDSMIGFGNRSYFAFTYDKVDDKFYVACGINGPTIIRSSNLINWDTVATLPLELQNVTGSTMTFFKGELFLASGSGAAANPYLWKYNLVNGQFSKVMKADWLGETWGNLGATDDAIFYIRGTTGFNNQKGCYYSTNAKIFFQMPYEYYASHATTIIESLDGKSLYIGQGNNFKTSIFQFLPIN